MNAGGWIKFDPDPMKGGGWPDNGQRILAVVTGFDEKPDQITGTFSYHRGRFEFQADHNGPMTPLYWQPLPDLPEDCR